MTDPIREAFERQYREEWPNVGPRVFARDGFRDEYANRDIQSRWEGWQAAWKQSRRETFREAAEICDVLERHSAFAMVIRAAAEGEGK